MKFTIMNTNMFLTLCVILYTVYSMQLDRMSSSNHPLSIEPLYGVTYLQCSGMY